MIEIMMTMIEMMMAMIEMMIEMMMAMIEMMVDDGNDVAPILQDAPNDSVQSWFHFVRS